MFNEGKCIFLTEEPRQILCDKVRIFTSDYAREGGTPWFAMTVEQTQMTKFELVMADVI